MTRTDRIRAICLLLIAALSLIGCRPADDRLIELSRQSLDRQAEQNRLVTKNNEQVIDGTRRLVEADSQSRQQHADLQRQILSQTATVQTQRDALEEDRRQIAQDRHRDPIIAESIAAAACLITAALPLLLCGLLLWKLWPASVDAGMTDVLLGELVHPRGLFQARGTPSTFDSVPALCLPAPSAVQPIAHLTDEGINESSEPTLIVILEGMNDIEFLRRISCVLNAANAGVPSIESLESDQRITVLRSSQLSVAVTAPRFVLLDRETQPTTSERQRLIDRLNQTPDCRAFLTNKRAIENYLHPLAIEEAVGVRVQFGDNDDVADLVACATFELQEGRRWVTLSKRARRRYRDKIKHRLNRDAVERMTPERLAERDPQCEVMGWLHTIARMAA